MEYLRGETLEELWPGLQQEAKDLILLKLRQVLEQIRAVLAPSFFGGISGGRLTHDLFRIFADDPNANEPFSNEREFIMSLINKVKLDAQDNKKHSYISDFLLPQFTRNEAKHVPTFTHADFHQRNILVEKTQDQTGYTISLVDWEAAGWYPSYWEYVSALLIAPATG